MRGRRWRQLRAVGRTIMQDFVRDGAKYSSADVLLFDAVPSHRGTTRVALGMMGFKQVFATSDIDELIQSISDKPFDVIVADLTGAAERICGLVREIRQGDVGTNPFLSIILTSWSARQDIVNRVMGCGADDVLIRPYSVSFLAERVHALVETRKGFVVTADYVGPSRRTRADRADATGLLQVPNTLRVKVKPGETGCSTGDMMLAVREARSKVGEMRLVGCALQMRLLAHFASKESGSLDKYLGRMSAFSRVLYDKLHARSDPALASGVASILEAVALMMQGERVTDSLSQCAAQVQIVQARLCSDRSAVEIEQEFTRAVAQFARHEPRAPELKTGT